MQLDFRLSENSEREISKLSSANLILWYDYEHLIVNITAYWELRTTEQPTGKLLNLMISKKGNNSDY